MRCLPSRDAGVQGGLLLAGQGRAPGKWESSLRAGKLGSLRLLPGGEGLSLQPTWKQQPAVPKDLGGLRGFGSAASPKSPQSPSPTALHPWGRSVGGAVAGLGLHLFPYNCSSWGYSPPGQSPRRAALWQGSVPLGLQPAPQPMASPTCPRAKGPQQRRKNVGCDTKAPSDGQGQRQERVGQLGEQEEWERGGEGTLLCLVALHSSALVLAWHL